jgi:small subunit ribosomal protein S4e
MGSKGNRRHTKRLNTPAFLQIPRKEHVFFIRAGAGPHPKNFSLPLGHIIRDLMKLSSNWNESKYILSSKKMQIDKTVRTSHRFPVGLMDVVEIADINKAYRVLPSVKHGLNLSEITKDEAKFKLCRIENIVTLPHGNLQLNLHDGRNILIPVKDASKKPDISYKTMGTLKISIPDQKILDYYPMENKNWAVIIKGKNIGKVGKIIAIEKRFGVNASLVEIESPDGEKISTAYEYTFIIGKDNPAIDLPVETK